MIWEERVEGNKRGRVRGREGMEGRKGEAAAWALRRSRGKVMREKERREMKEEEKRLMWEEERSSRRRRKEKGRKREGGKNMMKMDLGGNEGR